MSAVWMDTALAMSPAQRVAALDWRTVGAELDAQGSAVIPQLLSASECQAIVCTAKTGGFAVAS